METWPPLPKATRASTPATPLPPPESGLPATDALLPSPGVSRHAYPDPPMAAVPWHTFAYLIERYAPPTLLVNHERCLLWATDNAAVYLKNFPRTGTTDVLQSVVDDLAIPFAAALSQASSRQQEVVYPGVQVQTETGVQQLTLQVRWSQGHRAEPPLLLVTLATTQPLPSPSGTPGEPWLTGAGATPAQPALDLALQHQELDALTRLARHDLQGPLLQVHAFSEVLRRELGDTVPERVATSLHHITDGIQQIHALLQGLLTFSHLGHTAMQRVAVNLTACVQAALQAIKPTIDATQAEIIMAPLPEVLGDPAQLRQLYQHLLRNALQYVDRQPPRIHLTAQRQQTQWLLGVHDNGIGLDRQYAEYIFQPFNRLHTTSAYQGTGMGLALCRKIVGRHGGRIWVESVAGHGATFYFTLSGVIS